MKKVVVNQNQKAMLEYLVNGFENGVEEGIIIPGQLFEWIQSIRFFEEETEVFNELCIKYGLLDNEVSVSEAQSLHQYIANQQGIVYDVIDGLGVMFHNVEVLPKHLATTI